MHASLIGILLLFSRHVPAAPSNVGLGEPPGQQARGGTLHHMHHRHIDVYGRKIQKRHDDGTWAPDKFPGSPVEAPEDGAQSTEPPTRMKRQDDGTWHDCKYPPCEGVAAPEGEKSEETTKAAEAVDPAKETPAPDDDVKKPEGEKPEETPEKPKEEPNADDKNPEGDKPKEGPKPDDKKPEGEKPSDDKGDETKSTKFVKYDKPPPKEKVKPKEEDKGDHQECRSLKDNKYLFRNALIPAFDRFCNDAVKQGHHDEGSGGIDGRHYGGTADEVVIGIDWDVGSDKKPNKDDCVNELTRLMDNCNAPEGKENPKNVKAGGSRRVGAFTYRFEPIYKRYDYNNPRGSECRCDRLMEGGLHADCFIWGRGWASGDKGAGLKHHLTESCMEWGGDPWLLSPPKDGKWEWEARFQVYVGQGLKIIEAMHRAGAPNWDGEAYEEGSVVRCSGSAISPSGI